MKLFKFVTNVSCKKIPFIHYKQVPGFLQLKLNRRCQVHRLKGLGKTLMSDTNNMQWRHWGMQSALGVTYQKDDNWITYKSNFNLNPGYMHNIRYNLKKEMACYFDYVNISRHCFQFLCNTWLHLTMHFIYLSKKKWKALESEEFSGHTTDLPQSIQR